MERNSLKIGFDAKRLVANKTGLGNYSRFIVKALLEHHPEHTYYLFTPRKGHSELYQELLQYPNVHLILPHGLLKGSLWRTFGIPHQAKALQLDIFHGLSNELPLGISPKIKQVLTIHDLIFERFPKAYPWLDRILYHLKYRHSAQKCADKIIAISQTTAKDLQELYHIPDHKIALIYQGCREIFSQIVGEDQVNQTLKKYQIKHPYLLFVGTLEWRKNLGLVVKSLAELPQHIHLVAIGRPTSYSQNVLREAEELGLTDRIHLPQNISDQELRNLYLGAIALAYPSRYEGFGIPIIEALSLGIPVIAATGSCLHEAAGNGAIYVSPDSVEEFAHAVQKIQEKEISQQLITEGKKHIQQFTPKSIADSLDKLYRSIVHPKN